MGDVGQWWGMRGSGGGWHTYLCQMGEHMGRVHQLSCDWLREGGPRILRLVLSSSASGESEGPIWGNAFQMTIWIRARLGARDRGNCRVRVVMILVRVGVKCRSSGEVLFHAAGSALAAPPDKGHVRSEVQTFGRVRGAVRVAVRVNVI